MAMVLLFPPVVGRLYAERRSAGPKPDGPLARGVPSGGTRRRARQRTDSTGASEQDGASRGVDVVAERVTGAAKVAVGRAKMPQTARATRAKDRKSFFNEDLPFL